MIMSRYLMRSFVGHFVALLAGLVLFLQTLDLLATANEILNGGGPPIASLLRYVSLRAPSLIETLAPLAGLLGALMALLGMARNSEIIAMRAAGRSVFSLIGGLVAIGIGLSAMLFLFGEFVVVPASASLQEWRNAGFKADGQVDTGDNNWLIEGNTIIRVGHVAREGQVLNDIHLFRQGTHADITEILTVRLAVWEDDHWTMFDVERVGGTGADPPTWETHLKPEHFIHEQAHPNQLSLNALQEYVGKVTMGSRPTYFYETWLQQKIAGPIVLALMPLLAAIAAFSHHRQGSPALTLVWGITFGFGFIVIDNILLAMGQFGSLPPSFAAWLPLAIFATGGVWLVFNLEHTGART
ncbi:MAG: LPS export ABC transporter permease LptG [Rhodospirillaceae bacterium]|nr:LPS export ABC transporter permease LptG [Rhodospirillaceae bacterium]